MKPAIEQNRVTIYHGDVLQTLRALPDGFVQCVVTSPPYWGLRDYGTAAWRGGDPACDHIVTRHNDREMLGSNGKPGKNCTSWTHRDETPIGGNCPKCGATREDRQLGLEPTPQQFLDRMVEVFREVRRVLRADGTLWLNMGDSYMGSGHGWPTNPNDKQLTQKYWREKDDRKRPVNYISSETNGFKPKDLAGMPWRLAFALQADGWYLRSDIIWHKPNPMPESVTDRPTKAHEYIFLLTKSERYFYDAEAIKETVTGNAHDRGDGVNPKTKATGKNSRQCVDRDATHLTAKNPKQNESFSGAVNALVSQRNKRTVWTVPTEPFPDAHFATFPTELIKPCILAGTSERGACPLCGAPWQRIVQSETHHESGSGRAAEKRAAGNWHQNGNGRHAPRDERPKGKMAGGTQVREDHDVRLGPCVETRTIGWERGCDCFKEEAGGVPVPCVVLDPFMGSGTTAEVARMNGCAAIGIELNAKYIEIARRRLCQDIFAFS